MGYRVAQLEQQVCPERQLEGGDTYVFGRGYGDDVIFDRNLSSTDAVEFGPDVAPGDLTIKYLRGDVGFTNTYYLEITIDGTEDRLRIVEPFVLGSRIEQYRFSDGTVWSAATVQAMVSVATAGDDVLIGESFEDDTLDGGAGDDVLDGRTGADTYVFGLGYGNDVIDEGIDFATDFADNRIQLSPDILPSDIVLSRTGPKLDDLTLQIAGTEDSITVVDQFTEITPVITGVDFAGGVATWTAEFIGQQFLTATAGDDTLIGSALMDTLDGGAGNDLLIGRAGSDSYVFGSGYGSDRVIEDDGNPFDEYGTADPEIDAVVFEPGITPDDLIVSATGTALTDLAVCWRTWGSPRSTACFRRPSDGSGCSQRSIRTW